MEGSCPSNENQLKLTVRVLGNWRHSVIDPRGGIGPRLAFLSSGKRAVAYRDPEWKRERALSLDVSRVQVLRNSEALQINYFNNRGTDMDLVVQVTVAIGDVNLSNGTKIGLDGEYPPSHQRTTVIHAAAGEPIRRLPPVRKGDLKITRGGNPGEQMQGNFSMSFGSGGDLGAGRTLVGSFAGTVGDAGFGP